MFLESGKALFTILGLNKSPTCTWLWALWVHTVYGLSRIEERPVQFVIPESTYSTTLHGFLRIAMKALTD